MDPRRFLVLCLLLWTPYVHGQLIFESSFEDDETPLLCDPTNPEPVCGQGMRCEPMTDGSTACVATSGTSGQGSTCDSEGDCNTLSQCILYGSRTVCQNYCSVSAPQCGADERCLEFSPSLLAGTEEFGACAGHCPLDDPSLVCGATGQCTTDGSTAAFCLGEVGSGGQGTACSDATDCRAGFGCINVSGEQQCVEWCRVTSPDCSTGFCNSLSEPLVIQGTEWGVCLAL